MTNDEEQFLNDATAKLDARHSASLRKLQRQLRAAEAYEKRMQRSRKEGYLDGLRCRLLMVDNVNTVDKRGCPEWVPSSLSDRLFILKDEVGEALKQNGYVEVLERLCSDSRMEGIWCWLENNFSQSNDVSSFDVLAYRFSRYIHRAFNGMQSWDSLTQKQGEKKINDIVKLIGKLSVALEGYPVSESVLADLKPEEFGSLQIGLVRHVLRDVSEKIPGYFSEKIKDASYDTPTSYEDLYLPNNGPTLNELLSRVESRLRDVKFTSISTNSSDSGKQRYFIRVMASFMESYYGGRRDAQLAKITNVFFDDDIDDKRVADLFRTKT